MKTSFFAMAVCASVAAPPPVMAQAPVSGTEIVTLGTRGGPLPTSDRAQSSNLLIVNGTEYLIDAGDGVTRRIVQAGGDFRKVGKIFITHLHSDHTAGLATLMVSEWEYQRREPVDIYGSGVEELVRGAIGYLMPNANIRWSEGKQVPMADVFRGHEVQPGPVYQDANVKVSAAENTHFHFKPGDPGYGHYRSYAYRFETPGRIVVFTGDTGPSDAVIALAKGADVLVTEVGDPDDLVESFKRRGLWESKTAAEQAAFIRHQHEEHLTPEDVGKMASAAGVKMVVMTHFSVTIDPHDDFQRFVTRVKQTYAGAVMVAKDLSRF
jgi:ribonuclease BN (tRNA processing enzyme)